MANNSVDLVPATFLSLFGLRLWLLLNWCDLILQMLPRFCSLSLDTPFCDGHIDVRECVDHHWGPCLLSVILRCLYASFDVNALSFGAIFVKDGLRNGLGKVLLFFQIIMGSLVQRSLSILILGVNSIFRILTGSRLHLSIIVVYGQRSSKGLCVTIEDLIIIKWRKRSKL